MLTVCTVQYGNYCRQGARYVNNLFSMVDRHLGGQPYRRICFTDSSFEICPSIDCQELPHNVKGWWNKLYLFSPSLFDKGDRVLYFDLDTVILQSIELLADCKSDFAILRDFGRPKGLGSGVMLWEAGKVNEIWEQWCAEDRPILSGGDQAFIEVVAHRKWGHRIGAHRILQDLFPGMFASFKWQCEGGPGNHSVVCFHGKPKPHDCETPWVAAEWNSNRRRIAA